MNDKAVARALTIAGSDSGGGAGIQADIKTFTVCGVYGMSALTSITAQDTQGVSSVHDLPPAFVAEQINMVVNDIGVDAVKTGMLSNAGIIEAVVEALERHGIEKLVVDPVMVAKSGDALLQESAREMLKEKLLPITFLLTPNVPEAEVLTGMKISRMEDMERAAVALHALGPKYVLMKGGHLDGTEAADLFYDGDAFEIFSSPRFDTPNTHGTGCTYSAAITAYLAKGTVPREAVQTAKGYLTEAIRHAFALGQGHGPLNHFWPI